MEVNTETTSLSNIWRYDSQAHNAFSHSVKSWSQRRTCHFIQCTFGEQRTFIFNWLKFEALWGTCNPLKLRCHKNSRPLFVVPLRHGSVAASEAHPPWIPWIPWMTGTWVQERVPKWIGQCFSMTLPKLPATASVSLSCPELHLPTVIELIERIEPIAICKICKLYLHWTWYEGWPWSSRWALLTCQPVRSSQFVDWRHRTSVPTRGLSSPTAAVFSCRSIHQAVHWLMITSRTWSFGGCGILHFQTDPYKK